MTDAQLAALIRPRLAEAIELGRKLEREAQSRTFSDTHEPADGAVRPTSFYAGAGFTADDCERFSDYFSEDDDGYFAADLHRYFGLSVKDFADRSHLVRKQITNKNGNKQWVWVSPNKGKHAGKDDTPARTPEYHPTRDAETAVAKAVNDPHSLTADHLEQLEAHLDVLPRDRLRDLARQVSAKLGKVKADLVQNVLAKVRAQHDPSQAPGAALERGYDITVPKGGLEPGALFGRQRREAIAKAALERGDTPEERTPGVEGEKPTAAAILQNHAEVYAKHKADARKLADTMDGATALMKKWGESRINDAIDREAKSRTVAELNGGEQQPPTVETPAESPPIAAQSPPNTSNSPPIEANTEPDERDAHEMTDDERQREIARIKATERAALATPLPSEGNISPFQIGQMSPKQHKRFLENSMRKIQLEARLKELAKPGDQLKAEHEQRTAKESKRKAEDRATQIASQLQHIQSIAKDYVPGKPNMVIGENGKVKPKYQRSMDAAKQELAQLAAQHPSVAEKHREHLPQPAPAPAPAPHTLSKHEAGLAHLAQQRDKLKAGVAAARQHATTATDPQGKAHGDAVASALQKQLDALSATDDVSRPGAADAHREPVYQAYKAGQSQHHVAVENALKAGQDVPAHVLADYPELAKKHGKGGAKDAAPKAEVIGHGSTGEVKRVGDEVRKNAKGNEAAVYQKLAGVAGVAAGRADGGEIVTPHFPHVVSVDTVPANERQRYAPVVRQNLPDIVNAMTALSEAGYDYNDPVQVGFDKGRNAHVFDFSAAQPSEDATTENLAHLSNYLEQFGLARDAAAVSQIGGVLGYVNNPDARELDPDSEESRDAEKLLSHLDGQPAKYAYYSFNAREIPGMAQTEYRNRSKVVVSPTPLTPETMAQWELHPAIHRTDAAKQPATRKAGA